MAHTRQEERRPGIRKIFERLKKENPKKTNDQIAVMAKLEWTAKFGPSTPATKDAARAHDAEQATPCPVCHYTPGSNIAVRYRPPYAKESHMVSGSSKSPGESSRDSAQT